MSDYRRDMTPAPDWNAALTAASFWCFECHPPTRLRNEGAVCPMGPHDDNEGTAA